MPARTARKGWRQLLETDSKLDLGATPLAGGGVRFNVWAPAADTVEVELVGAECRVPLERAADGRWHGTGARARPGSRYFYVLNGERRRPDPYSRLQPEGPHGPSEVVDPSAYRWTDQSWRGLRIDGLVIYQVHVGTATPRGTLDALIEELPRLQRLGVNAIQLLPLGEFPGTRNWGYDGVDLFAVSHVYGGPTALRRFVDAAHAHRLGVILDVVYNHFGPDGNYLRDFSSDYFTDRYQTPWGEAVNYDGQRSEWVRKLVLDNAAYWIREYHADGLRLDATHAIYDASATHILADLTERTRREAANAGREVVLIAETGENDVRYLRPVAKGGFGLDAVYADDFHHILRRYLAGDHEGYYADYTGTLAELADCIERGWLYEGQPTPHSNFKQPRGTPARDRPAGQFLYVIQNHDQVGNRAFGDRLNQQIDPRRFAVASALLLFLPFTPMLFMGQEFAASTPFQYFTDHNRELGKLVTEGRRREFKAFSAFADAATRARIPDPQAESTFLNSKLHVEEAGVPPGHAMQELYRALLQFRRSDPVMVDQARERTAAQAMTDAVLVVRRWRDKEERLLVANFGDTPFDSESEQLGRDWHVVLHSSPAAEVLRVPPRSAAIFARST